MQESPVKQIYGEAIDVIRQFLAATPDGVPADILKAFGVLDGQGFLPPQLFLETVEQAPVAISITDPSARILYANSAFEKLTGYSREEVVGKNESMLSSKSTPLAVYQGLWHTIQGGQVWSGRLVNHRKGGHEYLAELSISPVLSSEGEIAYFLGMHRDITEMHALQQRLASQKGLLEAALNFAPMVVAMISGDGRLLLDNHAYKALLGDFRGTDPAQVFLEALEQQIGFSMQSLCDDGAGFTNIEVRLDPPGSTNVPRWFTCSGVRITDFDGEARSYFQRDQGECCLLLIANEVTASRKRINEARMNMIRANMAEQQMVQTMREAISASIFKLQVPINIVKAALSMSSGGGERATLRPVLQQALQSGEEAMDSLHNALPGPRAEQLFSVNVNELLHEVLHLSTDRLLANGIVVDWRVTPVLPALSGRPNALRALFKYLIDNSVQSLREAGQDYREMRLETEVDGDEVVVSIMDNGVGIADAEAIKVFEPFHCGWEDPRDHAGMGLTMAQEVVTSHGGSITVDRHFIGGCRIFVRLPYHAPGSLDNGTV